MAIRSRSTSALLVGEIGFGENREGEGEGHGEGTGDRATRRPKRRPKAARAIMRSARARWSRVSQWRRGSRTRARRESARSERARSRERERDRWGGWEGLARGEPKWRRGRSIEEASRAATLARSTSARLARAQRGTKIAALAKRGR